MDESTLKARGNNSVAGAEGTEERNAACDPLTGLPAISDFKRCARGIIDGPDAPDETFYFVYFNIENMKLYNEVCGRPAGDDLLVFTARIIEESFEHALVSRIGDDRFVILTYGDDLERGIDHVHAGVARHNDNLRTNIRAGVFAHDGSADMDLACDRAKLACDNIRGRYDVYWLQYDESLAKSRDRRQNILNKFDEALEKGHIQAYFQPIFRVIDTKVTEFEVLARWIDPVDGFISPADFIPVLEEGRLVHVLDLYILEIICKQFHSVKERGLPIVPANLNLSRLDMELCDIVTETQTLLERYQIDPRFLNIEITESAFGENNELLRQTIDRFHKLGVQVWMDDFGSGYSSLNVLREYDFDVIKFDMSFLRHRDEESHRRSREMLPHIISMMKNLGFKTLAEGVETQEQFDFLKEAGCGKVQGYLFAKPTPVDGFAKRMEAGEFGAETIARQEYMDKVGLVDLTAPATIDRALGHEIELSSGLPAAIVEFDENGVRYLAWNSSYVDYLRDIRMYSIENSTKQMNDLSRPQSQGFFGAAKRQWGKPDWVSLAFYEGEDLCTGRARCIAVDDESGTCAFIYIAFNISSFLKQTGYTLPKIQASNPEMPRTDAGE